MPRRKSEDAAAPGGRGEGEGRRRGKMGRSLALDKNAGNKRHLGEGEAKTSLWGGDSYENGNRKWRKK